MSAFDPDGADDLAVDEPVLLDVDGLEADDRLQAAHELVDRVEAGPRTRGVRALPVERHLRLEVAEAAGVQDAVGRLEHDDELGAGEEPGVEERRQRALGNRHFLPGEEEIARGRTRAGQLEHDGERRPSCRSPRARGRRRPRSGRGRCPAPERCRDGLRARRARRARRRAAPRRRRRAAGRARAPGRARRARPRGGSRRARRRAGAFWRRDREPARQRS